MLLKRDSVLGGRRFAVLTDHNLPLGAVIGAGHNGDAVIAEIREHPCFARLDNEILSHDIGIPCAVLVIVDEVHLHAGLDVLHLVEDLGIDGAVVSGNAVVAAAECSRAGEMPRCLGEHLVLRAVHDRRPDIKCRNLKDDAFPQQPVLFDLTADAFPAENAEHAHAAEHGNESCDEQQPPFF